MILPVLALIVGLGLLVWSADKFVSGSAAAAKHFHVSPLLIGMIIVGFGTSAPELTVSAIAAYQGSPSIALGNAYGSNITNIALILGLTAMINPITVQSLVLRKELPILTATSFLAAIQLLDGEVTRFEAIILLVIFAGLMVWFALQNRYADDDNLGKEIENMDIQSMALSPAIVWIVAGLVCLVISSRLLVWGAVEIARTMGISDLIIGLTVVAVGTSLPELASSVIAARKKEHDIALGNILGSNLFNTLAVVGIAGTIRPMKAEPEVLSRDIMMMTVLTVSLFLICFGFRKPGRINRIEGVLLLTSYLCYIAYLIHITF